MAIHDDPRPYFLPQGVDLRAMPHGFVAAYEALIQPAYVELVLEAATTMERTAGSTFVFLCFMELLDQFDLCAMVPLDGDADERHRKMSKCLRLIGAKERWARLLDQLVTGRKRDPLRDPLRGASSLAS